MHVIPYMGESDISYDNISLGLKIIFDNNNTWFISEHGGGKGRKPLFIHVLHFPKQ
jgi:hypothetical protein